MSDGDSDNKIALKFSRIDYSDSPPIAANRVLVDRVGTDVQIAPAFWDIAEVRQKLEEINQKESSPDELVVELFLLDRFRLPVDSLPDLLRAVEEVCNDLIEDGRLPPREEW